MNPSLRSMFEAKSTYCGGGVGSVPWSWLKILMKTGTMNISITISTIVAKIIVTVEVDHRALDAALDLLDPSRSGCATLSSTMSRMPAASPASTIAT